MLIKCLYYPYNQIIIQIIIRYHVFWILKYDKEQNIILKQFNKNKQTFILSKLSSLLIIQDISKVPQKYVIQGKHIQ